MRTNIEINEELLRSVMQSGGFLTKKAAVEEGLKSLRRRIAGQAALAMAGKIKWEGDLSAWRTDKART